MQEKTMIKDINQITSIINEKIIMKTLPPNNHTVNFHGSF